MNWKFLFFSFKGRIGRKSWWIGQIVILGLELFLTAALLMHWGLSPADLWSGKIMPPETALADALVFLVLLRPSLALDVKRIHDRGLSAWFLMPFYMLWLFNIALHAVGYDRSLYWYQPGGMALIGVFTLYLLWYLTELGFLRGTKGKSKYGPSPLGETAEAI